MFDIFYIGKKPGLFPHEKSADSIQHACEQSRTRYCWIVTYLADYSEWDWLWEPPPWQAHQRHAWPSQWQPDSGTYLVPKNGYTDTNYHTDRTIVRIGDSSIWQIPKYIDQTQFDFSWHPNYSEPKFEYHFGTQWQDAGGPVYPGSDGVKMVTDQRAVALACRDNWIFDDSIDLESFDFSWHPNPFDPLFVYQTGTQWQKTGGPRYVAPGATDLKYISQPRAQKISIDPNWEIPAGIDNNSFDWTWHPDSTEEPYVYQFGTQHQRTGGPRYISNGASEIKFVDQIRVKTQKTATKIYIIDHLDGNLNLIPDQIKLNSTVVRYFDNYLDTLLRISKNAAKENHEFVWIISSVCDYSNFDFTWHPEQWQAGMLHVFASDDQKFGDTFFMHAPTFSYRAEKVKLLEWYDVNFINSPVPRWTMPVIQHSYDSQVDAVKTQDWAGPLALFTRTDYVNQALTTVPLWREETKTIVPLSSGATSVIVPRAAVPYIKKQLYDYPYIDKTYQILKDEPLDIVFLSNGEINANSNWTRLENRIIEGLEKNKLHKVSNVKGRVASQHAAADASTTDWYFVVPGKLEIDLEFPWDWQPDRLQQPKHYIFHAGNPVNGLVYGHMAMVAYNKKLVLETQGTGLDFTLEKEHEVVPILSGTANYAESPIMAWRTAFREVIKLRASLPDVENEYRLKVWLTEDSGTIASGHWSHKGAQDAIEYYEAVNGDPVELKKSYEWDWLASYAFIKRGLN